MRHGRSGKAAAEGAAKSGSKFYKIYFLCVILSLLLIAIVCLLVRGVLSEYEDAQPKYAAGAVFSDYFEPLDYDRLLRDARYDAGLASRGAVQAYLSDEIGEEPLSYSIASSSEPGTVRYNVRAGKKQIGAIVLKTAQERTRHGFPTYALDHVELSLDPSAIPGGVLTLKAPAGCSVVADGTQLGEAQILETYLEKHAMKDWPSGIDGIEYAVYSLADLNEAPQEIAVRSPSGGESVVRFEEESGCYFASPPYDAALAEEHGAFVLEAVEGYAAYMQKVPGSSFAQIKKYFDPDSDLYRAIASAASNLWMVYQPSGNDFTDVAVDQFYAFSEDLISCHVAFTQLLYRNGQTHTDAVDMLVYLHKTGGSWSIFEWYNNT